MAVFIKDSVMQTRWCRSKLFLNNKYVYFFNAAINTVGSDTILLTSDLPEKLFYSTLAESLDSNSKTEVKTFSIALCEL